MISNLASRLRFRLQRSETTGPVLLAILVGLAAGTWSIFFRGLIRLGQVVFFDGARALTDRLPVPAGTSDFSVLLVPAIGLAVVVLIVERWAPEAKGHGVPEVQHAVRSRGGIIRGRVAIIKALASATCIGSGGSVGREGPIVQIGSAVGSTIGRVSGLGPEHTKLLVACGAAGGIGATFNAPIAGVIFALEVILGSFAARSFGLVVISSVSATAVSRAFLGREPAFQLLERFSLASEREFMLYLVLGMTLGLLAALYVRSVYGLETLFNNWKRSSVFKALVGGLVVGALGLFGSNLIFGVGYEGVQMVLDDRLALHLMLLLVGFKLLATSITLAAGGSGGVFAPALFIGAMAGGAFGQVAHIVYPDWTAPSGAYALVGMAGLFGAAAHAPMTAAIILFEMTDDYQIILPLMLTVVVSHLVKSRISTESIYSVKLENLEAQTSPGHEISLLDNLLVADVVSERFEVVAPDAPLEDLTRKMGSGATQSWPVVVKGSLVGIISQADIETALVDREDRDLTAKDIMTTAVVTLRPEDTLREGFRRFSQHGIQLIPVVEGDAGIRIVGVVRRHEMVWAYQAVSEEHRRLIDKTRQSFREPPEDIVQIEFAVDANDVRVVNRTLHQLQFPHYALVSLVRRNRKVLVPHGETMVQAGDVLVILTEQANQDDLKEWLSRPSWE